MEEHIKKAAEIIKRSGNVIALTGAGHSVESGIPDFRGTGGLWTKFDPIEYAHIETFRRNPEKVWELVFHLKGIIDKAMPNPAHMALAKLEKKGILKAVITQNIDNLHQEAGSKNVIEFHGNFKRLECIQCGSIYEAKNIKIKNTPPKCAGCGFILKPGFVFFGEMIPKHALLESTQLADAADAVLVIGTSAEVHPAAGIPYRAKKNGAAVIEMNLEKTGLTSSITDIFIGGRVGATLPMLLDHIDT